MTHLPKLTRYTLGVRIDGLFADCLALTLKAKYARREEKAVHIQELSVQFDSLKFFLQLLWEMKALEDKQYLFLSQPLVEIGKLIGKWLQMDKATPPVSGGVKREETG